jgi:hypothetical protein
VFKGLEIFQIAIMSNREKRAAGITIGILAIFISIIAAISFAFMADSQALSISKGIPQ